MEQDNYDLYLNALETVFSEFLQEAKKGKSNKSAALRSRKKSIKLRESLKEFRNVSLANQNS